MDNRRDEENENSLTMDYLQRRSRILQLDKITNKEIRRRMKAEDSVVDKVKKRGLK